MKLLDHYKEKQNSIRGYINKGNIPVDQLIYIQELNYRICVLETMRDFTLTAPVTTDIKVLSLHYQTVDAYIKFLITERQLGLKTDDNGIKKRETSYKALENVVNAERRKYAGIKVTSAEQYKEMITSTIGTVMYIWVQYRTNFINL